MMSSFNTFVRSSLFVRSTLTFALISAFLFSLGGCAQIKSLFEKEDGEEKDIRLSAQTLSGKGMDEYSNAKYYKARKFFGT